MADYLSYLFGGVVIVGGIIGFAKAGITLNQFHALSRDFRMVHVMHLCTHR